MKLKNLIKYNRNEGRAEINNKRLNKRVGGNLSYNRNFPRAFKLIFIIGLILIILQTKLVLGNFVCGQVEDSDDNVSASWYSIRIFYPSAQGMFTSCQVSPAGNKYCCDTEAIPGKSWKIGDVAAAEIFDNETGYVAGQVSVVTTGEGYSIFPIMKLEKVIKIYNFKKIIFSNTSEFLLNASFREPYNLVEIENLETNNKSILCLNCSRVEQNITAEFGMNYLKLIASYGGRVFSEDIILAILRSFGFNRKIECEKCRENIIKSRQIVNMTLILNLSDVVNGLELKEYVPVDFEILDTDGRIEEYSETHNLIIWNVSGKDIEKKYVAKAPKISLFPRKYIFRTELENELINESEIIVSRFFKIFSSSEKMEIKYIKQIIYSRIYPGKPLVIRPRNSEILRVAVFPKKIIKNAEFGFKEHNKEDIDDAIVSYLFKSNFLKDIEKIFLEFKIEKEVLENYENISLFVFNNGEWQETETEIEVYEEDENYFYYRTFLKPCRGVAIAGKNKKTFFGSFVEALS